MCAHDQGKFWEFHDKIFENQRSLSDTAYRQFATDLGLNEAEFEQCYDGGKHRESVQQDFATGNSLGVNATPAFFINGRFLSGAQPFEAFKAIIDEELGN